MKIRHFILLLPFLLSACMKGELPVPAHDPGDVITSTVSMESDYRYQIYFNLAENREVGRNLRGAWDLGFESSPQGFHVVLNGSKMMYAAPATGQGIATLGAQDTAGFDQSKAWDAPSGSFDSTAIGDWRGGNGLFLIDRGFDHTGKMGGVYKIRIVSVDASGYDIEYGPLQSATPKKLRVLKDTIYNFAFLNLDSAATSIIEPPRKDWDLVFTQYTHTFYSPEYGPYLVTGVLLNHFQTKAAPIDSAISFNSARLADMRDERLRSDINAIGYDWKVYTGNTYLTNAARGYFILDQRGYRYKLHFIDFLSSAGVKGAPKWEYQTL